MIVLLQITKQRQQTKTFIIKFIVHNQKMMKGYRWWVIDCLILKFYELKQILALLIKQTMKKKSSDSIFMDQKNSQKSDDKFRDSINVPTVPYLKRGDSSVYVSQFLSKEEEPQMPPSTPKADNNFTEVVHEQPKQQNAHSEQMESPSEERTQTKMNPSAFHNFQKHLTVGLKHAVVMPPEDKITKEYVRAAAKLWKAFSQSKICTKKVLHFLLGDRNEHQITAQDLREFGLAKIYDSFGQKVIREARVFLMKQTLRQVQEGCLERYFEHKKIKDKQKFRRYIQMFVEELEQGFLRKRLPREKVAELMAE